MAGDNFSRLLLQGNNAFQFMMQIGASPMSAYWFQSKAATVSVPVLAEFREPLTPELESWEVGQDPKLKAQKNSSIRELLEDLSGVIKQTPAKPSLEVDAWFNEVFKQTNEHLAKATRKLTVARGEKKQGKADLTLQVLDGLVKWVETGEAESTSHEPLSISERFKIVCSYQYHKGDQYSASLPLQVNFKNLVTLLMEIVILLQANNIRFNILGGKQYLETPAVDFIIYLLKKIDYINIQNEKKISLKDRFEDYETITGSLIQYCDENIKSTQAGPIGVAYNVLLDGASLVARVGSAVVPEQVVSPISAIKGTIGSQMPNRQGDTEFIEAFRAKLCELFTMAKMSYSQAQPTSSLKDTSGGSATLDHHEEEEEDPAPKAMISDFEMLKGASRKAPAHPSGQDALDLLSGAKPASTSRKKGGPSLNGTSG